MSPKKAVKVETEVQVAEVAAVVAEAPPATESAKVVKIRKSPTPKKVACEKCGAMRFSQSMKATLHEDKTRTYECKKCPPEPTGADAQVKAG